jgi:hypothetical protein
MGDGMSLLRKRLAAALEAGRATRQPTAPLPPPLKARRMLMALVQGRSFDEVQANLASLRKIAAEKDLGLVIVTDQTDIALFQIPGCITEYLASPDVFDRLSGAQDPQIYVARRLGILVRKWEPVQVAPFGDDAISVFANWQRIEPKASKF